MKVSVITINLNNSVGLSKTIPSVLAQTYTDFEFIVIDGGSTDGSLDIIKKNSKYISYWVSERDSGIYNAFNKGIKQATADYCLFLNSGDWFCSHNVLEKVFELSYDEDIIYGNRIEVEDNIVVSKTIYPEKLRFSFLFSSTLCHQTAFIKRSLFETFGYYNEEKKYDADWEFFLLCFGKYECSYKYLPMFISYYDLSGISNNTDNWDEMIKERETTFKNLFPLHNDDYKEYMKFKEYYEYQANKTIYSHIKDIIKYIAKRH